MASFSVLSITDAGPSYVFQWRPSGVSTSLPVIALQPLLATDRQALKLQLEQAVNLIYTLPREPLTLIEGGKPRTDELKSIGGLIYRKLFPPVIQELLSRAQSQDPLVLSTNDTEFPWELAFDGESFLGTRFMVGRELQLHTAQRPRTNKPPPPHSWNALLISNPTGDLPAAEAEADAIFELIQSSVDKPFVELLGGSQATKKNVQARLGEGEWRLIHYSGHIARDTDMPSRSGLVLADRQVLTAPEIQKSLAGQPWVFLNGCASTGTAGTPPPLEGSNRTAETHELATGFMLGGAQTVLGTLWEVPDHRASAFARSVYTELFQGTRAGEAMRKARLAFSNEQGDDPIWAAYVLYGSPQDRLVQVESTHAQNATILIARVAGLSRFESSTLLEKAAEIGEEVLSRIRQEVARYGGDVIWSGHGQLTVAFGLGRSEDGAKPPSKEQVERALRAALSFPRILRQVRSLDPDAAALPLEIAVGVATGPIVYRRASNNVYGPAAEDAAWLAAQAEPGQILAAGTVMRNARDFLISSAWTLLSTPRQGEHLRLGSVHQVQGIRSGLELSFRGPLIGREKELVALQAAWHQVAAGHGRIIDLCGEAGIGKTRLIQEFVRNLRGNVRSVYVQCTLDGSGVPYSLLPALTRGLIQAQEAAAPQALRERLQAQLHRSIFLEPDARRETFAILAASLGAANPQEDGGVPEDSRAYRARLVQALRHLVGGIISESPLLIIIEDLHNVDESSAEVLERLSERIDRQPLLFLALYRPEWQSRWLRRAYATRLALDPLSGEQSERLVRSQLQDMLPPEDAKAIAEWSGGNPLFIGEVVRTLQEQGALAWHKSVWSLTRRMPEVQIPTEIQELIQNRVDRLLPSQVRVIQAAAVLGTRFVTGLVARMLQTEQTPAIVEDALQVLEQHELIQSDWQRPDIHFAHDLIQAAVYGGIKDEERRALHLQAAQAWDENRQAAPIPIEHIAHHLYGSVTDLTHGTPVIAEGISGAHLERAALALVEAADKAFDSYANRIARRYYEQAQEVIRALKEDSSRRWVNCFERLGEAATHLGDLKTAAASLERAFGILRGGVTRAEDRRRAADIARRIGRIYSSQSAWEPALNWMAEGLYTLGAAPDKPLLLNDPLDQECAALLFIHTGSVYYLRGDMSAARPPCEQGLAIATRVHSQGDLAIGYNLLAAILDAQGQSQEAFAFYQMSYALQERLGNQYELARVAVNIGTFYFYQGAWAPARRNYEQCRQLREQLEDRVNLAYPILNLGSIDLHQGKWQDAESKYAEALELATQFNAQRMMALAHNNLGYLRLEQQDWTRAAQELETSRELASDIPDYLAETLRGQAELALGLNDPRQALELANQALVLDEEQGLRPEKAFALRTRARAYAALDQSAAAFQDFRESLALLEPREFRFEAARTLYHLARVEYLTHLDQLARAHLVRAVGILETLGAPKDLERAQELGRSFASQKDLSNDRER